MNALLDSPIRASPPMRSDQPSVASILYVEDDEGIRRLSIQALTRSGYWVTGVADGLEGWEALDSEHFDLLITDNEMPRLTGLELVARARAKGMHFPIIVVSGSLEAFAGTEFRWLRLAATLRKPLGIGELVATVQQVLRPASSARRGSEGLCPTFAEVLSRVPPARHWGSTNEAADQRL